MTRHLPEIDPRTCAGATDELEYQPDRGPEMLGRAILTMVFVAGVAVGIAVCHIF